MAKKIGQILLEKGYVNAEEIKEALKYQKKHDTVKLGEALIKLDFAAPDQVAKCLAEQWDMTYVDLSNAEIPDSVIELVAPDVAKENMIYPVELRGRYLVVAASKQPDFFAVDNLRFLLNHEIETVICSEAALVERISKSYGKLGELVGAEAAEAEAITLGGEDDDVGEDDAPVIKLVNSIIVSAINKRSSDIHFEPMETRLRVRFRVDGVCVEQDSPPKKLQGAILARLKIMAKMNMAEKRLPQDGRIKMQVGGRGIDFRVSSLPANHGESVVLRILDQEKGLVDLEILGLSKYDFDRFHKIIKKPNGIFLVTGPTGSGKTTTLYAALKKLNRPDKKIITAENPVEYNLSGINQAQVNHQIGFTFARILKAMLRQAPNVILVGEIRDEETAEIAIQAALTGHFVFSTLHTNDAPSSVSRLVDIGIKPFMVASALVAIMAQRLVRKLCPKCKRVHETPRHILRACGVSELEVKGKTIYEPKGCEVCNGIGYRGRMGVYELMDIDPVVRELIFANASSPELRSQAIANGMYTLQKDGVRKVLSGLTTFEEILRITHTQDLGAEREEEDIEMSIA